jgi:hypothetical protein
VHTLHSRSKHIDVRYNLIHDVMNSNEIQIEKVQNNDNAMGLTC